MGVNDSRQTGLDEAVQVGSTAAKVVEGAAKAGTITAAAANGAALGGPYGAAASVAVAAAKHGKKILLALLAILAIPLLFLVMLPTLIFGGTAQNSSDTTILNDQTAITENMNEIAFAVSDLLGSGIADAEQRIADDFAASSVDQYEIVNPYENERINNVNLFISQYCAYRDTDVAAISLEDMKQLLRSGIGELYDYMEGLQLTMQRVKIPGGGNLQFEIRGDDPDNPDYERKLVGVILYHHLANAYWPEGSEYDDNVPPFCQSFDGKQGYGEPGGVCAACAFNQFGSTANGSGKACKNMRQIYLLRSGEYLPLQLSLPPTSLRPFNDFMNLAFVARRRPSYSAIVEIGLKRAESGGYTYSVATFRKVQDLEGEGLAAVKSYAANFKEQVKSLLAQRVENYKSDVESLTGTAPLELADNGDHFSYPGVIDGERDELPL